MLRDVNPGAHRSKYIGIDLSLSETGFVVIHGGLPSFVSRTITSDKKQANFKRMLSIRDELMRLIRIHKPSVVGLEGYAKGAKFRLADMAELGGIVRAALHDARIPFIEVPPTNLKKYATGKGVGDKIAVVLGVMQKWKVRISNHNVCDAYVLARMVEGWHTRRTLLKYESDAMAKVVMHMPNPDGSAR